MGTVTTARWFGRVIFLALWSVAAVTAVARTQAGRDPQALPAPTLKAGTGAIAGVITAGDTGRPMRRARVTLTNSETSASLGTAVTDVGGRFSFSALPAVPVSLRASKAGYLDVVFGQKKPGSGRPGTSIQLADGQKIDNIQMRMPRGGVISGVVVDEVGDPVLGVPVRAWRYVIRNGARELTATSSSDTTDDRGQYRVPTLLPGDYVVCAVPRDELVTAGAQYEAMLARAEQVRAQNAARGLPSPPPPPPELLGLSLENPKEAYITVCFPGTTQKSEATTITLDLDEERPNQNIQLQLLPIAPVAGRVVWNDGKLPTAGSSGGTTADTQVHLVDRAARNNPDGSRVVHVKADGSFVFTNVQPGQYTLEAHADVPMPGAPAAAAAPGARPSVPPVTTTMMTPLWASVDISVSGQAISDLTLTLAHGMNVSGQVVTEGATIDLSLLRVTALPAGPMYGEFDIPTARVGPDGRFTITGVVPGTYRIGSARGSSGAVIKSSVFGGVDTLDVPIDVKPGMDVGGGVLTAIPRFAEITGQLLDAAGKPGLGYTVIAFPVDLRHWTPASRRIQAVRPATDGRFTLRNLPAGEYRLAAVTDVETGEWFDPAFLRVLLPGAVAITLAEGERKDQLLRIGR